MATVRGKAQKDAILKGKGVRRTGIYPCSDIRFIKVFRYSKPRNAPEYHARRNVKDERVIQWIKRYLKSGVMENGVVMETEEGSPQGGNISPLLANIYLNEFDQEFEKRKVAFVRYADDIVILFKE